MLEDVSMELLTQQGLCPPGSMRTCIGVQQNNSTWELASSAGKSKISSDCRKRITPHSQRDYQSEHPWRQLSLRLPGDKSDVQLHETTFQHHTEHQKPMIGCNKTGVRTICENVLYSLDGPRISSKNIRSVFLRTCNDKIFNITIPALINIEYRDYSCLILQATEFSD